MEIKETIKNLFFGKKPQELKAIPYDFSDRYRRYTADLVGEERRMLDRMDTDALNIGRTTRGAEIESLFEDEIRYAEQQFVDHLKKYRDLLQKKIEELKSMRQERSALETDRRTLSAEVDELGAMIRLWDEEEKKEKEGKKK